MVATQSVKRKNLLSNDVLVVLDIIDEALKTCLVKEGFFCVDNKGMPATFYGSGTIYFLKINIYYCACKVRRFITKQKDLVLD